MMVQYGLGRLPAPDERDKQYRMASILLSKPLPLFKYYQTGPVLSQGNFPHCVGYAWRQWLTSSPMRTRTGPQPIDIYRQAQKVDEWEGEEPAYEGTSVRAGAKVLQSLGHVRSYLWAWSADTVANWLLSGEGTVVLGTTWYSGMTFPSRENIMVADGQNEGGHAFLCMGYNRSRGLFRIINSWGPDWADRGRAWMPGEVLEKLLGDRGEACTAVEQRIPHES